MRPEPPTDSHFTLLDEPEICGECQAVSRLTNGLCLNCLFQSALEDEGAESGREAFKETLAAVRSRDGDWHIADHEILAEIARGGMGVVYQAKEPHSERIVALKCVLAYQGDADHMVARFRREAETAARLDHPNIVPIYQVGETADGFPYYTMKYAPAGSLLQARHPLLQHPRRSVQLLVKVARAVQFAHEKGVLHRDLKPGNILMDEHGEPLVSDFGLARCESTSSYLTRSLASFGTPGYIAPEQADGPAARLTAAADIYSLGAILFELLTGRPPFVGDNAFAVMKQSAENPAPKLRTIARNVDRDLEIICARCLEREPADRYQSAAALADDLQNWLEDRPIAARRAGVWRHSRRWIRRNRRVAVSLGALCVLGVVSVLWQVRAQKIQSAMKESLLAARSVVILPLLDLDTLGPDTVATQWVVNSLSRQFETLGSGRISTSTVPGWSKLDDIRRSVRDAKGRVAMTGTVRSVDGKRRVSLRLLDPVGGKTLYSVFVEQGGAASKSSDGNVEWGRDILRILNANEWSAILDAREDPGLRNPDAAEFIKSARQWMSSYAVSDLEHAIDLLNRALALEPNSALAHTYLAMAATCRTYLVADPTYLEVGRSEALKALALEPGLVEAHRALASVYYQERKFSDAFEEGMRCVEMGGAEDRIAMFIGMTLDAMGRPDRALRWYAIVSELQVRPGEAGSLIGDSWARLVDDERAFRAYDRAMELQPSSSQAAVGKCHLHLLRGEFELAREICRTRFRNSNELGEMAQIAAQVEFLARNYAAAEELYTKLAKADANGGGSFYGAITYQSALGRIKQELGSHEEAAQLLRKCLEDEQAALHRQPDNADAVYRLAAAEASLGLSQAALQHLHQAVSLGWLDYRSLQRDPRFDSLRSLPELDSLIDELSAKVADLKTSRAR